MNGGYKLTYLKPSGTPYRYLSIAFRIIEDVTVCYKRTDISRLAMTDPGNLTAKKKQWPGSNPSQEHWVMKPDQKSKSDDSININ